MVEPAASFEDHLAREIVHSERMRMAILAGLLGVLIAFYGLGYALSRKDDLLRFLTPAVFVYIIAVIAPLLCYELAIRYLLGRRLRRGKRVPGTLRYLNAFVETSVPSILILLVSREVLEAAGEDPGAAQSLGPVKVKGREQPIELFRLA